jgi:hypothetical protein
MMSTICAVACITTTNASKTAAASAAGSTMTKSKKSDKKDKGFEVSRRMEGGIVVSRVDGRKVDVE